MGHELTHGLDDNGRKYVAAGSMTTLWGNETIEVFAERTVCFVEQYGGFTATAENWTEVSVDGQGTLGKNIPDAGGLAVQL